MNSKQFAKFLENYADLQKVLGARESAHQTQRLADVFKSAPPQSVDQVLSSAEIWMSSQRRRVHSNAVNNCSEHFAALEHMLKQNSTAAKLKPLKTLLKFLADHGHMDWKALIRQLNEAVSASDADIIRFYVAKLNADFKNPHKFPTTFDALKKDKRIKVGLARKIASDFTGQNVTGTKAKAFDWVWKKHQYYVSGIAASNAMAGKSAA